MSDQLEPTAGPPAEIIQRAERTEYRLNNRVGYSDKKRHKYLQAAWAYRLLELSNYTIVFKRLDPVNASLGLQTIWQFIAYKWAHTRRGVLIQHPTDIQRWTSVSLHRQALKQGFRDLQRHLLMDDSVALYMVPSDRTGSRTEVITLDQNLMVNESETARDIGIARPELIREESERALAVKLYIMGQDFTVTKAKAHERANRLDELRPPVPRLCQRDMFAEEGCERPDGGEQQDDGEALP